MFAQNTTLMKNLTLGTSFLILLFAAISQTPVLAQTPNDSTLCDLIVVQREVVITAQRHPLYNFALPLVTTVVSKETLQKRPPRTVPEALEGAAGVFLQKTNHGGGSPFLRGLTGQQTLLLVDGIRLNNATFRSGPNQYINTIDPAWVERIEVLESSGAAEYGSDAIGGVVNVLTHSLSFSDTKVINPELAYKWISGGMENSGQAALTASRQRWAVRGGAAYRDFGDLIAGKGLGKESPNGYSQWSGELKAMAQISRRLILTAAYQDLQQKDVPIYHKVQLENFEYNRFNPQRRQMGYARLQAKTDSKWLKSVDFTASRQYMLEVRESQKNNQPIQTTETDKTGTNGLQLTAFSAISRRWRMTTGAEWYSDAVRSSKTEFNESTAAVVSKRGLYPDHSTMQSLAVFNLHNLESGPILLVAGWRYNAFRLKVPNEVIGTSIVKPTALTGNIGASVRLNPEIRAFVNTATAFRAPNIDDLGTLGIVDFRYEQPNYQLQPEKSRSVEGGLKWEKSNISAYCSVYQLQLRDLIGRLRTSDTIQGYAVYQKENITDAWIRGWEAAVKYQFADKWTVSGHTTYTFGQNTTANEPLRRIPPFNGRAYVEYAPGTQLSVRGEMVFAADQRRLAKGDIDDNRIADDGTPGWQVVNLSAFYQFKRLSLSAEWHNILNQAYRTHGSGVDGMGRSVWLRVAYSGR